MIPPGPVAVTVARSIPRSLASFRTGGFASTCTDPATSLPAATEADGPSPGADTAGATVCAAPTPLVARAPGAVPGCAPTGAAPASPAPGTAPPDASPGCAPTAGASGATPPATGAGAEPAGAAEPLRGRRLASVVLGP